MPGAPPHNQNATKHGLYSTPQPIETITDAITSLASSLSKLATYIENRDDLTVDEMTRLSAVYGQNLSRIARMMRDRSAIDGEPDGLDAYIEEALKLASQQLGVNLTEP